MIKIFTLLQQKPQKARRGLCFSLLETPHGACQLATLPGKPRKLRRKTAAALNSLSNIIVQKNSPLAVLPGHYCATGTLQKALQTVLLQSDQLQNEVIALQESPVLTAEYCLQLAKKMRLIYWVGQPPQQLVTQLLQQSGTPLICCNTPPSQVLLLALNETHFLHGGPCLSPSWVFAQPLFHTTRQLAALCPIFTAFEPLPLAAATIEQWQSTAVFHALCQDITTALHHMIPLQNRRKISQIKNQHDNAMHTL